MGHHQELQPQVDEPSLASRLHRGLKTRPSRKVPEFATFLQKPPSLLAATPSPGWLVGLRLAWLSLATSLRLSDSPSIHRTRELPASSRFPPLRQLWAALTTKGQMENLHCDATRTKLSQPFSKQWISFENQSLKDIYSES